MWGLGLQKESPPIGRRTASRRNFCDPESLAKRYGEACHKALGRHVCRTKLPPKMFYIRNARLFVILFVCNFLGPVHGRTDFSWIFIFEPPDFFADFLAGFFLLIFVGKSAQKNPPRKSPGKSSKIYTTKIPDTFLQRGRAKIFGGFVRNFG